MAIERSSWELCFTKNGFLRTVVPACRVRFHRKIPYHLFVERDQVINVNKDVSDDHAVSYTHTCYMS